MMGEEVTSCIHTQNINKQTINMRKSSYIWRQPNGCTLYPFIENQLVEVMLLRPKSLAVRLTIVAARPPRFEIRDRNRIG